MTAYTLASYRNTTFNLTSADSLEVTHQGSIFIDAPNATGILGASGNVLTLNGVVSSVQADAVLLSASNNSITVGSSAMLYGGDAGVSFAGGSNAIANSGTIIGGIYGVECAYGGNSIVNAGSILGFAGLRVGTDPASGTVVNTGEIRASRYDAVYADGAVSVTNSGVVDGAVIGINTAGSTGANTIINSGYLYGRSFAAASFGGGADVIVNSGFMQGYEYAANLGNGSDFFDGRNGIQVGTVSGGGGNDVLYGGTSFDDLRGGAGNDQISGGASADYLDGGADFDLVRYDFATAAVTVNLASPAANTGEAAGDVLLNFEGIVGSNFADMLIGNGDANTIVGGLGGDAIAGGAGVDMLFGGAGADVLFGEAGGDLIAGGAGGDIIRGGLGGDLIVFNVGDNGDLILNFNEGGVRDGFDLRGFFDATGYAGTDPRGAGLMQVLQNGADTDVYLYDSFAFRIEGVVAAAINDTYFLFQ
jgi:Ca2+-binding RTX toxin-like protein